MEDQFKNHRDPGFWIANIRRNVQRDQEMTAATAGRWSASLSLPSGETLRRPPTQWRHWSGVGRRACRAESEEVCRQTIPTRRPWPCAVYREPESPLYVD